MGLWLGMLQLLLVVVLLVPGRGAQSGQNTGIGRRLLIRPMPGGLNTCRNTNQGPWFMTDDKGKVCGLKEMDFTTGCCSSGEQHYCGRCDKADSCCESFEYCVSCCMAPENKPDERRLKSFRIPSNKDSGVWADGFEFCLSACRTHSISTSHENAYIAPRHHCFSKLGKPMLSPPLPEGALKGVTVVLSAAGASCTSMCQGKRLTCSASHLHFLNSCDQLREVTNCEAGCQEEDHEDSMPAAVDLEAPKQDRPALCLVSKGPTGGAKGFSCDATANYMRRLCPCVEGAAGQEAAPSASDAPPGDHQQQQQEPAAAEEEPAAATHVAAVDAEQPGAAGGGAAEQASTGGDGGVTDAAGSDDADVGAAQAAEQEQQKGEAVGGGDGNAAAAGDGPGNA